MRTFIFYLCVDFLAVLMLLCADNMVSNRKRRLIQNYSGSMILRKITNGGGGIR